MTIEIVLVPGVKLPKKGPRVKSELRVAIENFLLALKNDSAAQQRIDAGFTFDVPLANAGGVSPESAVRLASEATGFSVVSEVIENGAKIRVTVHGFASERKPRAPRKPKVETTPEA